MRTRDSELARKNLPDLATMAHLLREQSRRASGLMPRTATRLGKNVIKKSRNANSSSKSSVENPEELK